MANYLALKGIEVHADETGELRAGAVPANPGPKL